ncbi:MAG: response regulator transcription factor [Candidatus Omnitrophica bacterium]|nr:response regulator transcription factor [Candidatus Omnitrophota bacterium]
MGRRILAIDDEKDILELLKYNLEREGYGVLTAQTGERGFELAKAKKPDLILLDLMLPGVDGFEICKLLKNSPDTRAIPILMLTAKNSETDQVLGIELGAADYLAKPFGVKVLLARIKNIFRNKENDQEPPKVIRAGDFVIDRARRRFTIKDRPYELTKLEFNILGFLMENPDRVFSRDELLSGAWGTEAFVVDRTVDAHIRSIRKKLGSCRGAIETVRGTGYRFNREP